MIDVATLNKLRGEDRPVFLLDTRTPGTFSRGFIPESIFIGPEDNAADTAAALVPVHAEVVLISDKDRIEDDLSALKRAGFTCISVLSGGFEAWEAAGEETDMLINVEADELMMDLPFDENLVVMDVREEAEFEKGHLESAENLPLAKLTDPGSMAMIEESDNIYIHSGTGYRSVVAASMLKRQGIHNLRNVVGGWSAISRLR